MSQMTEHDRTRIAAEGVLHVRTVRRVYDGAGSAWSRARVERAAATLGLPTPPGRVASKDA